MLQIAQNRMELETYDKFYKKKKKKTFSERFYNKIGIDHHGLTKYPGRFGKPKINEKKCGNFKSAYTCQCGASKNIFLHACNNVNCPKCYLTSIKTSAKRETQRINHIQKYLGKLGFTKHFLRHASVNITKKKIKEWIGSESIEDYEDLVKVRKHVRNHLKKLHFSGVLIYHAYRRKRDENGQLVFPQIFIYSPHFHTIGHGWVPRNHKKKFGWTLSHLRWILNDKGTYNAIKYVLTHASYFHGKHLITWYGQYSYNKLVKINKIKIFESIHCEQCDDLIYLIDIDNERIKKRKSYVLVPWYWRLHLHSTIHLKEISEEYEFEYKNFKKTRKK